jgi:hypothetical protein
MSMLICKLTTQIRVVKLRIIYKHIVAAASILDVNVKLMMVKLLTMYQYGYGFDLPFFKGRIYSNDRRQRVLDLRNCRRVWKLGRYDL